MIIHHLQDLLKRCREEANLSQEELAVILYVDRSYVSKVENGKIKSITYEFVKKWGAATNRSELISMDFVGDNELWKRLAVYRMAFMQIKQGIDMLDISV